MAGHGPQRRTLDRLADIETSLRLGIEPHRIAADVGATFSALNRWLHRNRRPDLARHFHPYRDPSCKR